MSPRKITKTAMWVGGISVVGGVLMVRLSPRGGVLRWWPVAGMFTAMVLVVIAYLRGAYLAAEQRVHMVDLLNDCYQGEPKNGRTAH